MRFPLRAKFFVFATLIATAPLALVGQNLTRIARDELKSAANEDLTGVASGLAADFDATVRGRWLTPLLVIRSGVDSEALGVEQKISLLTLGLSQIPDIAALQLSVEGSDLPILVTDRDFSHRLAEAGLDPVETLRSPPDAIAAIGEDGRYGELLPWRLEPARAWLATVALPLQTPLAGRTVTLSAQIDLAPLAALAQDSPFTRRGEIAVVDAAGRTVLDPAPRDLADRAIVAAAVPLIAASARAEAVHGYDRADGQAMLGAYAFPDALPWAVVAELSEASAYAVVHDMLRSLLLVGLTGFGVAAAAAILFAGRLTGPILRIGDVAARVGAGDLTARVRRVRTRDELGDLAGRMNTMIRQLSERMELMKFVSHGTMTAISTADAAGVARGGERRRVAVLFSDIRGYTRFSESVAPEVVVEMLNQYLDVQAAIVERHGGDVDKFIGDELIAVFQGEGMERNAVACGLEIQGALADLLEAHPDWNLHAGLGIAAGEVVMGAIGSHNRLDFTVLGGVVNLASRLCDAAPADAVLVSRPVRDALAGETFAQFAPLPPIALKGLTAPVAAFVARAAAMAEELAGVASRVHARRWLGLLPAALILGPTAVALNVSFAAIIYTGDLARFVDRGIALTLLGAAAMAAVGAIAFSYRGTVAQPQDAPAIILSLAAAGVAAGMPDPGSERSFATVAALVIVTSAASGLAAWTLGRFRLGFVARFIPFPVIGGFLAATGYLLVMGGLGMAIGTSVGLRNLPVLLEPGNPMRWLPWAILAVAVTLVGRRVASPMVLPAVLLGAGAGFYLLLALAGMGPQDAGARGLLLGPFGGGGFLPALRDWRPLDVDWLAIARQSPSILTIVGLATATSLLGASVLEVLTGTRVDPDRELRGVGLCNLAAAATGGPVGYQVIAETVLARQLGSDGPATGLIISAACLAALVFGASVVSMIPVGLLVLLILAIGLRMVIDPLVDQRRSLPPADYAVVLVIPAVTAAFGFTWGVAVGLLAATLFFIVTFARIDVVRVETTAARMRSRIERPDAEQARLASLGQQAAIYVLAGYIFFGTAHRLVARIQSALGRDPGPRFVVIDLHRVRGLDTSAARALARLDEACRASGVRLFLTGLAHADSRLIAGQATGGEPRMVAHLEDALEEVETALLADAPPVETAPTLIDRLRRRHPAADLDRYVQSVSVPAGAEVIAQGAPSDFLLLLRSGLLRTEVQVEGAAPLVVARCLPGALIGEIGLYAGVPRTACVVAEEASEFLRVDATALGRMARDDPTLLADFHREIAATIARRLGRTTALLADSELQAG